MKIGVLALQGDFDAHRRRLEELGAEVVLVKKPEQLDEIAHVLGAGNQQQVTQSRSDHLLQRVVHHRVRANWQEMFIGDLGELTQSSTLAARQDYAPRRRGPAEEP